MAEQVETPVEEKPLVETPSKEAAATEKETLLGEATETPEQKAAAEKVVEDEKIKVETENKRLLEADDKTLKPEELTKKQELVKAQEEAKANSVPEKYEIKAPEGMTIDPVAIEKMSPLFKELNLTSVQAQKLVDTYAPIVKAQAEAQQKAAMDLWTKETEGWKAESLKQLGADAPKELAFAAKVINKVGTRYKNEDGSEGNKLRDVLQETRVGNHPEITKLFIQIGKLLSEDSFVEPNRTPSVGKVDLYDHPDSKNTLK